MKLRPRDIPKYQGGNTINFTNYDDWRKNPYYSWFISQYPLESKILSGNPLAKDLSKWQIGGPTHHQVDDLAARSYSNYVYTRPENKANVTSDIQNVLNKLSSKFGGYSINQFVTDYNAGIDKMHDYQTKAHSYTGKNDSDTKFFNPFYNSYYKSKGTDTSPGGILYNTSLEGVYGTQTYQRDVDLYLDEFDLANPDLNRIHEVTLAGKKYKVYKKANGHIGLYTPFDEYGVYYGQDPLPESVAVTKNDPPSQGPETKEIITPVVPTAKVDTVKVDTKGTVKAKEEVDLDGQPKVNWTNKFAKWMPELFAAGRLAGNIWNNYRVFDESLKAIRPVHLQTYNTYRRILGDEATKLLFYGRAAKGETYASRPVTSDASLYIASRMDAKAKGDELRAQGDLADNQEIRRTSDESNQHQWANVAREALVGNLNYAADIQADAARHNLLAQRHSANWTSIDNYMLGLEYRMRQKLREQKNRDYRLWELAYENRILNDERLLNLLRQLNEAWEKSADPSKDATILDLRRRIKNLQFELLKEAYETMPSMAKSGMKITYKSKDDLLYKSTKDAVEHFRKMSKLSSDALNRKRIKIENLISYPKKMLQGGVAPFTIYKPVALGGEQSTTTSSSSEGSSSSRKKGSEEDELDVVKELFKNLIGKGLPVDVDVAYNSMRRFLAKKEVFGDSLSTEDIATMYLQLLRIINDIQYQKEKFDKAKEIAMSNDALTEMAVTPDGRYVVQDRNDKEIKSVSLDEYNPKKHILLRNSQLLNMREYSEDLALNKGSGYLDIVSNGIGMDKIGQQLKSLMPSIGNSEKTIEGYTKQESNAISKGLELLKEAPSGVYKFTEYTKDQKQQIAIALNYIKHTLPQNSMAVLKMHAKLNGTSADNVIISLLQSSSSNNYRLEFTAATGKAASGTNGSGSSDNNSAALAFIQGQGPRELINFNIGTSNRIRVLGIKGALLTHSGENLGQGSTLQDATKSTLGASINWEKATFGGSRLNPLASSHIILNDSTIVSMDLPYVKDFSGNEIPDFLLTRKMEEADLYIFENKITDPNKINEIYRSKGLADKFVNGKLNKLKYRRFAAIQVTLDEQSLKDKNAILSDEVLRANDVERELYIQAMRNQPHGDKKYDLSNGFFGRGKDELYKGTIFVPYSEDIAFAGISAGKPFDLNLPNSVAAIQEMQYAPKASQYKAPELTLSQIKNN